MKRLLYTIALLLSAVSTLAQQSGNVKEADINMLKSFYSQYITNILENKDKANVSLKTNAFSPELLEEISAITETFGFDPIINAQDVNEAMLKSLKIEFHEKPDWYVIKYSWNGKDETSIKVKMGDINNRRIMTNIIPIKKMK